MYINNKTMYSLLMATTKPAELVKFAKDNDLPAIGICDNNSTLGFHSFSKLANLEGVKAILAVDTFVMFKNNVEDVLLICTNINSLYEINKALSQSDYFDYSFFEDTIIVFKNSLLTDIGENNYIGVTSDYLITNEPKLNSNMLIIDASYFLNQGDFEYYQLINAIEQNTTVSKVGMHKQANSYLKLIDHELWFSEQMEANYLKLVAKIEKIEFEPGFKLPHYNLSQSLDNHQFLYKLTQKGLKRRLNHRVSEEYLKRLDYEFKVIKELDFVDYFLIVWDIVKFCKSQNIYVGPGRGSAAGSLLSYCLGITSIDPVANGLLFERFLNPMRKTMPDIDLDFEDTKREQVINYIIDKYGTDYVCKIGTLSTYQAKSSFREIAKAFDINKPLIEKISKQIDSTISFKDNILSNKNLSKQFMSDGQLQYILDYIYKIEDIPKNRSIHAAGIIISDKQIYNYTSIHDHVSDVDSKTLETMGLVKFDILAISNLRRLADIEGKIFEKYKKKLSFNSLDINDKNTYHGISDGNTNFVFQLESAGMIQVLKKFRPVNFDDLAAILALYRPGPMQYIDEYISRKNGNSKISYISPRLKPVLESTYGIIIYQEQIMEIVRLFAGYDLGQADIFRRAISKKDKDTLLEELNKFVIASIKNGYQKDVAVEIGNRILAFANYGFNKSHAYSYAKISYALMYYKVNFPDVYYSYYMNELKSTADLNKLEREIKYFDLELHRPNIKKLCLDTEISHGALQLGLNNIKGLNDDFKKRLYEYTLSTDGSLTDIIDNIIVPAQLSQQEIENLVMSGIFDVYDYNEKSIIEYITNKDSLQDRDALFFIETNSSITKVENYQFTKLEELEKRSLNLSIKYNSYDSHYNKLIAMYPQIKRINQVDSKQLYTNFDILVYITRVKEIKAKTNKLMAFIDCKVESLEASITVFPEVYMEYYDLLTTAKGYALVNVTVINKGFSLQKIKMI